MLKWAGANLSLLYYFVPNPICTCTINYVLWHYYTYDNNFIHKSLYLFELDALF